MGPTWGRTMPRLASTLFRAFNVLQEAVRISVHLGSVPGFLNDTADAQSRGVPPSSLGVKESEVFVVPWTSFSVSHSLEFYPSADLMSYYMWLPSCSELNFSDGPVPRWVELPAQFPLDFRASEVS